MARKQGSHAGITGPKVREAALRLFARHGYAAVSMRQIAAEVGVQAGALYTYTPDKQSLLSDLMLEHMRELMATLAEAPGDAGPLAALEGFVRNHIRFHLPRADAVFVSYMELRNLTPENFARVEALRRQYEAVLEAILERGAEAGTLRRVDARVTAMALIALMTGVTNWYREGGRLPRAEIEEIYWDLVRRAVAA